MHRRMLLLVAALCGCKSRGTITLDFDLDGMGCKTPGAVCCAPFGSDYWTGQGAGSAARCDDTAVAIDHYVLYAEAGAGCNECACGGCAGTGTKSVSVCPDPSGKPCSSVDSSELGLSPGLWAVVLEAYAPGATSATPPCLVASQCIEVTVDADGVANETVGLAEGACAVCAM